MVYTKNTKLAMKIAYEAYNGKVDASGVPYIFHSIHLAEQMEDEDTTIVALLHSIVNMTDITLDDIESYGFKDEILDAIWLLTQPKRMKYDDYIDILKINTIARKVKIADLIHNCDASRLEGLTDKYMEKYKQYVRALKVLRDAEH